MKIFIKFSILFSIFCFSFLISNSQPIVPNGSFEVHDSLPGMISSPLDYEYNQLMKCIGSCTDRPQKWPPNYCFTFDRLGWYLPTRTGSTDYFHVLGYDGEGVPFVHTTTEISAELDEYRWPYGVNDMWSVNDSAYIGIRFITPNNVYLYGNTYLFHKEYTQIRLEAALTGGQYKVTYFVSSAKKSWGTIKKICAHFSENPIVEDSSISNIELPNDNSSICSTVRLSDTANASGFYGWQEVTDTLIVPSGKSYHYMTIGNFQSDKEFWNDFQEKNPYNKSDYGIYYFIDNVSIEPIVHQDTINCYCNPEVYYFNTKPIFDIVSNKCCYEYELWYPEKTCYNCLVCKVSKFKIIRNGDTLADISPNTGNEFPPDTNHKGLFCVDDFDADLENDVIQVLFYTKEGNNDIPMYGCEKDIELNCKCDCSDLSDFPYPEDKLEFRLVKVDSSAVEKCCWEVFITNLDSLDTKACKYDLSNKFILFNSDSLLINHYSFTPSIGSNGITNPNQYYWLAPNPFIIKPGESIKIGMLCSEGFQQSRIKLKLTFSNSEEISDSCKTVMEKILECKEPPNYCCDLIELSHKSSKIPADGDLFGGYSNLNQNNFSAYKCSYPFYLNFKNSSKYCNDPDSILVTLYNGIVPSDVYFSVKMRLKDLYSTQLFLRNVAVTPGQKIFCVDIWNLRTNEHCVKCDTITCVDHSMEKIRVQSDDILFVGKNDEIQIRPNPAENFFELLYYSPESGTNCSVVLRNNIGQQIISESRKSKKGINSITFSTVNLQTGIYFLQINNNGRKVSRKIIINK